MSPWTKEKGLPLISPKPPQVLHPKRRVKESQNVCDRVSLKPTRTLPKTHLILFKENFKRWPFPCACVFVHKSYLHHSGTTPATVSAHTQRGDTTPPADTWDTRWGTLGINVGTSYFHKVLVASDESAGPTLFLTYKPTNKWWLHRVLFDITKHALLLVSRELSGISLANHLCHVSPSKTSCWKHLNYLHKPLSRASGIEIGPICSLYSLRAYLNTCKEPAFQIVKGCPKIMN